MSDLQIKCSNRSDLNFEIVVGRCVVLVIMTINVRNLLQTGFRGVGLDYPGLVRALARTRVYAGAPDRSDPTPIVSETPDSGPDTRFGSECVGPGRFPDFACSQAFRGDSPTGPTPAQALWAGTCPTPDWERRGGPASYYYLYL